eukprot:15461399-Alexandrium_andersonii.AAC.1
MAILPGRSQLRLLAHASPGQGNSPPQPRGPPPPPLLLGRGDLADTASPSHGRGPPMLHPGLDRAGPGPGP